mgnify:CR=1 FL=1
MKRMVAAFMLLAAVLLTACGGSGPAKEVGFANLQWGMTKKQVEATYRKSLGKYEPTLLEKDDIMGFDFYDPDHPLCRQLDDLVKSLGEDSEDHYVFTYFYFENDTLVSAAVLYGFESLPETLWTENFNELADYLKSSYGEPISVMPTSFYNEKEYVYTSDASTITLSLTRYESAEAKALTITYDPLE